MNSENPIQIDSVLYAVDGKVATITLNRPERLNALGHEPGGIFRSLMLAMERADSDVHVNCIVLRGAGKGFSAGGDLNSRPKITAKDWYWFLDEADVDGERIRQMRKPVIGAVHGFCLGAALVLALHLDLIVASEDAKFGLMETRFGQPGADLLAYFVGPQWAKFMSISGELLTARKAKEIGLVLEVLPADGFDEKVADLARRVADMPTDGVAFNRRVVNSAMNMMGWHNQKSASTALAAVLNSVAKEQKAFNGRTFADLRTEGWAEFKNARDSPFTPPWLDQEFDKGSVS